MKAEKKASEKEAKTLEQKKETNAVGDQNDYGADEETLDPNVSFC